MHRDSRRPMDIYIYILYLNVRGTTICLFIYLCMNLSIYRSTYRSIELSIERSFYSYRRPSWLCVHAYIHACTRMYIHIRRCITTCTHLHTYMCTHARAFTDIYLQLPVFTCMYIYMYISTYTYTFIQNM